ncbi:MAG: DUF951 domain-containing protein [Chloroflexota bacterium]
MTLVPVDGYNIEMQRQVPEIDLDDIVRLRKKHPCGSFTWKVTRLGVDIGLMCCGCNHRILLPRGKFNKQFKKLEEKVERKEKREERGSSQ